MAKSFAFKKIVILLSCAGILGFAELAQASAFQLGEQDGASVGNSHAGRAAIAEDASTAFYNPAGLTKIHNQQLVVAADPVITNIIFRGTVDVLMQDSAPASSGPIPSTAQGGTINFVPAFYYAAPMTDKLTLAIGAFAPFAAKTDYGTNSYTRYASTLTLFKVVDFSPSFGYALTDKLSIGAGLDIERANAQFDLVGGSSLYASPTSAIDTYAQNTGSDHAYGYHVGLLYDFSPATRVGLDYQSKVVHVLHGTSLFFGPLANDGNDGTQSSDSLRAKIVLPATTTLSLFHTLNPTWDVMGTVGYTQWNVMQQLVLTNVAGVIAGPTKSNDITVTIPLNYRNTWNFSAGANYHVNEKWMLRSGIGYDQTPSNNQDRNLPMPDANRITAAIGAHYQMSKAFGFDAGWMHVFVMNTRINNTLNVGEQSTTVVGTVQSSADVYGFQVKWDIV